MPTYEVKTNMGTFEVDLNRPPNSREELMQAVESKIAQSGGQLKVGGPAEGFATNLPPNAQVKPIPGPSDVLNKVFEGVGEMAGEPVRAGTMALTGSPDVSAAVGAAANAAAQVFGPGVVGTGLKQAAKGVALTGAIPGKGGAQMWNKLREARSGLGITVEKARGEAKILKDAVSQIPASETIPMPRTQAAINALRAEELSFRPGAKSGGILDDLNDWEAAITAQGGAPGVHWVNKLRQRVGEKTKVVAGVKPRPEYQQLYSTIMQDLENSPVRSVETSVREPGVRGLLPTPTQMQVRQGATGVGEFTSSPKGQTFEAGPMAITRQVQSPPTERGSFSVREQGGRATLEPKQYIAPTSGEIPYSGVITEKQAVRPTETSATGRRMSVLRTTDEQNVFRDPATGEIVAPGTRAQRPAVGPLVTESVKADRRAIAISDFYEDFKKMVKKRRGTGGMEDINPGNLLNRLDNDKFLRASMQPEDIKTWDNILTYLNDTGSFTGKGVTIGAGQHLARGAGLLTMTGGNILLSEGINGLLEIGRTPVGMKILAAVIRQPSDVGSLLKDTTKLSGYMALVRAASKATASLGSGQ